MPIETVSVDDLPEILAVFKASVNSCSEDYSHDQINAWLSGINNKAKWLERIESQYFICARENGIQGFASLKSCGEIDVFFVHPNYQNLGVGKGLLKALLSQANKLGVENVTSFVSKTALPFFSNNGFKVIRNNEVVISGVALQNYLMQRK